MEGRKDGNGHFEAVTEIIHQFEWRREAADSSEDKISIIGFLGFFRSIGCTKLILHTYSLLGITF